MEANLPLDPRARRAVGVEKWGTVSGPYSARDNLRPPASLTRQCRRSLIPDGHEYSVGHGHEGIGDPQDRVPRRHQREGRAP